MRSLKGKVAWLDYFKPNEADIAQIKKVHAFHPILLDEMMHPSGRARIEHYEGYIFIVHHFPIFDTVAKTSRRAEINFLITKDKIITAHYEQLEQLDTLFESIQKDAVLHKQILGSDTLMPLYHILEKTIELSLRQLRHVEEHVSAVAQDIFSHKEEELLRRISYIKRDILEFRLIIHPQEKLLAHLAEIGVQFWGQKSRVYLNDLINDNTPVHRNLDNYYETIESLETTNAQLLDAETNTVMKKFTVGAFLFSIPLYFVFFSEFQYIHELLASTPARFWTSFIIVHGVVISLWLIFKRKKIL